MATYFIATGMKTSAVGNVDSEGNYTLVPNTVGCERKEWKTEGGAVRALDRMSRRDSKEASHFLVYENPSGVSGVQKAAQVKESRETRAPSATDIPDPTMRASVVLNVIVSAVLDYVKDAASTEIRKSKYVDEFGVKLTFPYTNRVTGEDKALSVYLNVKEQERRSYYRGRTNVLNITMVSSSARAQPYPEPKAGYDVDKMVQRIVESVRARIRDFEDRARAQQNLNDTIAVVDEAMTEYGLDKAQLSAKVNGSVQVLFRVTPENLKKHASALQALLKEMEAKPY